MRAGIHAAVVALLSGVLLAACGSTTGPTTATSAGAAANAESSATTSGEATSSTPTPSGASRSPGLAFAECMRAHGVPNFPDPQPGPGVVFNTAGINPAAPAARAAQAKCQEFMRGGPAAPGPTTHPSAQTLAKLLGVADCMRRHGVPQFPDPRTSVPPNPLGLGYDFITDYDGAILLFPSTLNRQSPAYTAAATACGTLAEKLGSGPH